MRLPRESHDNRSRERELMPVSLRLDHPFWSQTSFTLLALSGSSHTCEMLSIRTKMHIQIPQSFKSYIQNTDHHGA